MDSDCDAHAYGNINADRIPDKHAYEYAHGDAQCNSNPASGGISPRDFSGLDVYGNAYAVSYCDIHAHTNEDCHPSAHADSDQDCHTESHTQHYPNAEQHAHSHGNDDANEYPHPHRNQDADTVAYPYPHSNFNAAIGLLLGRF